MPADGIDLVAQIARDDMIGIDVNRIVVIIVTVIFHEKLEFPECAVFINRTDLIVHVVVMHLVVDAAGGVCGAEPVYFSGADCRWDSKLVVLEEFIFVIELVCDVEVVAPFFGIEAKGVVDENPFAFEERLGILEVDFEPLALLEILVFAFEVNWGSDATVFPVKQILPGEMGVYNILSFFGTVACGKPEIPGACELVDVFAERPEAFVGNRKIEAFGSVEGDERIYALPLFHNGFEIEFGERRGNRIIFDVFYF